MVFRRRSRRDQEELAMRRTPKWIWISLVLTLVAGASVGVVADRTVLSRGHTAGAVRSTAAGTLWFDCDEAESAVAPSGHRGRSERMARVKERLRLDEGQVGDLRVVFERHGASARDFWQRTRSDYCEMRDELRGDVRSLLRQDQRAAYDELLREIRARHKRRAKTPKGARRGGLL